MNRSPYERLTRLEGEVRELRRLLAKAGGPLAGLVGRSEAMQHVFDRLLTLADYELPVVVFGESGTGRHSVIRALHQVSLRQSGALVGWDGSSPLAEAAAHAHDGILLAEENAHTRSAVGAHRADELRQSGRVRLAFVAEADTGLADEIGAMRLYLPPLRERREDIPTLVDHFLALEGSSHRQWSLDPRALEAMASHEWPGNVRELRNVIARATRLTDGPAIGLATVQSLLGGASAGIPGEHPVVMVRVGDSMAEVERRMLLRTLEFAKGNKRKAAEILKWSLKTVYNKLNEYGLEGDFKRRFRKAARSSTPTHSESR